VFDETAGKVGRFRKTGERAANVDAGSFCGKSMTCAAKRTLGAQRQRRAVRSGGYATRFSVTIGKCRRPA
jgi:hypothetical protein